MTTFTKPPIAVPALRGDYVSLPARSKWKSDSSVMFGARDKVLLSIDDLVEETGRATNWAGKADGYFQLYFALDYWLGHFKTDPAMNEKRQPAVHRLYRFVAGQLCRYFGCSINMLPNVIQDYFGREMTAHGARIDGAGRAISMPRARIEQYKLYYKTTNRKFYQLDNRGGQPEMVLASSAEIHAADSTKAGLKAEYANFVLTLGGDFYMAPHLQFSKGQSWFHSTYRNGQPVQCAGSIRIEEGRVTGLQNNSGHYQPTDLHMLNVLRHLQMLGHPVQDIEVWNYTGKIHLKVQEFMAANGNWEAAVRRHSANFQNWQGRMDALGTRNETIRRFQQGIPLKTLVDQRQQANPGKSFQSLWDEVVLEIMSVDPKYQRHLGALLGKPKKFGAEPPVLSKPAVPTSKPWKK